MICLHLILAQSLTNALWVLYFDREMSKNLSAISIENGQRLENGKSRDWRERASSGEILASFSPHHNKDQLTAWRWLGHAQHMAALK